MKILYLSGAYVPSRRASSVHVMKMCSALASRGHEVILVCKKPRSNRSQATDFEYYAVPDKFSIQKLARPAAKGGGLLFALRLASVLARGARESRLVYSREIVGAWLAARLGYRLVFEVHGVPPPGAVGRLYRAVLRSPHLVRLVVISQALRDHLQESDLLPPGLDVVLARDAADPSIFEEQPTTSLPRPLRHVGYVGSLYPGRGIELILELAHRLSHLQFDVVGGAPGDIERVKAMGPPANVDLYGFVEPRHLQALYSRIDVLLMPYQERVVGFTGRSDISRWFSPMKMFEYMAAGRPIVSSDLPVVREVLRNDGNALLVDSKDIDAWEMAIRQLERRPDVGARLAETARAEALGEHTWERRAAAVLKGLES